MEFSNKRKKYLFFARLAEQCGEHNVVLENMDKIIENKVELTIEERNLLLSSFKRIFAKKNYSLRPLFKERFWLKEKEKDRRKLELIENFIKKIEDELIILATQFIQKIDDHILPYSTNSEDKVFYFKLKADYFRNLNEISSNKEFINNAVSNYEKGLEIAQKELNPTNLILLGLILNYSVFCHDILMDEKGYILIKKSFETTLPLLETLSPNENKEISLLLQLYRDNIKLWESEKHDVDNDEGN